MGKYLLAHDLGTTGDKAVLFSEDGTLVRALTAEYRTDYLRQGFVEQDPEDWWRAVCETSAQLLRSVDKKDLAAVSFSGQMMGCLCVDKSGNALRPSIIWADTRSVAQADALGEKYGKDAFYRTSGHRISSSHTVTKLMWIRDNEPEVYRRTHKTLCAKDYIVLKLTGRFVTDYSDASGTLAYNIGERKWADDIIEAAGLEREMFPEILPAVTVVGEVGERAARESGLPLGLPVVLGGGDGPCGLVGTGCVKDGTGYTYLGTSAWSKFCRTQPVKDPLQRVVTWNHVMPEFVAPTGTIQAAGASITWMKENLCAEERALAAKTGESVYRFINENAAKSKRGAGGLLFLPHLQGERAPFWNVDAKGAFAGLTMRHTANDMKRAVFEGIAMNMGTIFRILQENKIGLQSSMTLIGGGANSPILRQTMADIYEMDMLIPDKLDEATSMGAAIVAGKGVGIYDSLDVIDRFLETKEVVHPVRENTEFFRELMKVFEECYFALEKVDGALNRFQ